MDFMATATKRAKATTTETQLATAMQQATSKYAFPIKEITPLPDFKLRVVFSNGIQGTVDFSWVLEAPAFESVRDPAEFAKVRVSADDGCIMFGEDLDVAWEPIYSKLSGKHWPTARPPDTWKLIKLVYAEWVSAPKQALVEFNNGVSGEIKLDEFVSEHEPFKEDIKGPDEFVVTPWGNIVVNGVEYDSARMFHVLTGEDIDTAEKKWNTDAVCQ